MLSEAERIGSDAHIVRFKDTFDKQGYLLIATHDKPSSKEVVECLANITFYVTKLDDTTKLLGLPPIILPEYIRSKRGIYALTTGSNGRYNDNLCFFMGALLLSWIDYSWTPAIY